MILWINLVTNGLPCARSRRGSARSDPDDGNRRGRRSRAPSARATTGGSSASACGWGVTALACYLWPWKSTDGEVLHHARAISFSLLALSPLSLHAFNCRSPAVSIFAMKPLVSKPLVLAVALSAAIHLVAILVLSPGPCFGRTGSADTNGK